MHYKKYPGLTKTERVAMNPVVRSTYLPNYSLDASVDPKKCHSVFGWVRTNKQR